MVLCDILLLALGADLLVLDHLGDVVGEGVDVYVCGDGSLPIYIYSFFSLTMMKGLLRAISVVWGSPVLSSVKAF